MGAWGGECEEHDDTDRPAGNEARRPEARSTGPERRKPLRRMAFNLTGSPSQCVHILVELGVGGGLDGDRNRGAGRKGDVREAAVAPVVCNIVQAHEPALTTYGRWTGLEKRTAVFTRTTRSVHRRHGMSNQCAGAIEPIRRIGLHCGRHLGVRAYWLAVVRRSRPSPIMVIPATTNSTSNPI